MAEGQLTELVKQLEGLDLGNLDQLLKKQEELRESLSRMTEGSDAAKQVENALGGVSGQIDDIIGKLPDFAQKMVKTFVKAKEGAGKAMADLQSWVSSGMGDASKAVEGIMKKVSGVAALSGLVFTQAGQAMLDPIRDSSEIISGTLGATAAKANAAFKSLLETQNVARRAFIAAGHSIDDANEAASKYVHSLRRMSLATGISGKDLNNLSKELSFLGEEAISTATPGLSELTGTLIGQGITAPAAAATAFRGLGFDVGEATNFMKQGFMKFNEGAMETSKTVGDFAEAAEQTGHSTLLVVEPIRRASEALAIFGRGSTAAAEMWTTFTKALRDDVPLEQTNQMVQQLTSNLANMKIQERAFITMISGMAQGATALGGGLKMELAMRTEEGMQRNFEALTESLRKFGGGQIITIEQAANNPQLEMQFQVQRQMLGRLAGITNQEQQNRMLQVMQQVERGGMSQIDGSKKMQEVFSEGLTQQQKEITFLEKIARNTALMAGSQDKTLNKIDEAFSNTPEQLLTFGAEAVSEPGMELGSTQGLLSAKQLGSISNKSGVLDEIGDGGERAIQAIKGAAKWMKTAVDNGIEKFKIENIDKKEMPVTELPTTAQGSWKLPSANLNKYDTFTNTPASLQTDRMLREEPVRPAPSIDDLLRQTRSMQSEIAGTRTETVPEVEGGRETGQPQFTLDINPIRLMVDDDSLKGITNIMEDGINKTMNENKEEIVRLMVQSNRGVPIER